MNNKLREQKELLEQQLNSLLESFYEDTGWAPMVTSEFTTTKYLGKTVLTANVEVSLQ